MGGELRFIQGPMNGGKSTQLLVAAYKLEENNIPFIIFKSSIDTRDSGVIHSRPLGDRPCVSVLPEEDIIKAFEREVSKNDYDLFRKSNARWVLVDESQFLTEKQVDGLATIADVYNVNVVCYGLKTDFQRHLFPGSKRLIEIADEVEEIKTTCRCGRKALFNVRIDSKGKILTEGAQVEVGAEDKYITLCRKCYNEKLHRDKNKNL